MAVSAHNAFFEGKNSIGIIGIILLNLEGRFYIKNKASKHWHQELDFALAVLGRKSEVKHSKACAQSMWRKSIEAQP